MNITTTDAVSPTSAIFVTVKHNQFYKNIQNEEKILIVKILCPTILITIFLIIITVVYIKCCRAVPRCTGMIYCVWSSIMFFFVVPPQDIQEPRCDGTVSAGTWRKYKVMKERKLPPIPEESCCGSQQISKLTGQRQQYSIGRYFF